jgi:hypothetical protein
MALDQPEGKAALSADGMAALMLLEEGKRLNAVSRAARELIALGLAVPGWSDDLDITEAGRRRARRGVRSEHVTDLSCFASVNPSVDPMASPTPVAIEPFELAPEAPSEITERGAPSEIQEEASDTTNSIGELQRAQRAAGVASGVTGVWVDEKWVHAFVDAWVQEAR